MYWFKCCPKCGGDLYQAADRFGRYIGCLQCGHILSEQQEAELQVEAPAAASRKAWRESTRAATAAAA